MPLRRRRIVTDLPVNVLIGSMIEPECVEQIRAVDPTVRVVYEPDLLPVPRYPADHGGQPRDLTSEELGRWRELLAIADVMFDFDWMDPGYVSKNSPKLKWIQATSSGIGEFVDQYQLRDSGITFTTAGGVHAVPLAEFALAGALYFIKGLPELVDAKASRHWERYATQQLAGRRVTVVGLGRVGRHVAQTFHLLGAKVSGVGRCERDYGLDPAIATIPIAELDGQLTTTDVLVLCCPLTPQTYHLLDRRRLALLPDHAVLVNIARGDVVDEEALTDSLVSRRIAGACLDVFSTEPLPKESPLWQLPNVIVSPHSASTVGAENALITDLFCRNLESWLAGRPLTNVFQPERGY
jgi:phosphoglycerate dehydrogenase-like enzyme